MKKTKRYGGLFIFLLYVCSIICLFVVLGTMVSKKFELDEKYWRIDGKKLSKKQQSIAWKMLDEKGKRFDTIILGAALTGILTFAGATMMMVKHHRRFSKQ